MSSLDYLCEYGSDSEEDLNDVDETKNKRLKLPVPDLSNIQVVPSDFHEDDPKLHGGRIRSFPHVRGNWPSFVFVKYPDRDNLENLINKIRLAVSSLDLVWEICEDPHISLSKTVVLLYHWISSFNESVQKALSATECFELGFSGVQILCNDDNTRTFIVLEVDCLSCKSLLSISKSVDKVLTEYNLPLFYDKPSFHMSILWVNGNKKGETLTFLERLNEILLSELNESLKTVIIDKVNCKIGNRHFQYSLL